MTNICWRLTIGQMLNILFILFLQSFKLKKRKEKKKKKTALKCGEVKLPEVLLIESNTDGIWTQIS